MRILSLCTGIGGIELGLKLATKNAARTVCICEGEAYCASVLRARMQDGFIDDCPIWSDLTTFDAKPWRGAVDLITGGFPCQPFSQSGRRQGDKDPRHLWPYIADIVATITPAFVFCENVPGLLTLGFEQVCGDLQGLGYAVEAGIFSAEECGAPHQRQRLFFLAYTNSIPLRDATHKIRNKGGQDTVFFKQHNQQGVMADPHHVNGRVQCAGGQPLGGQDHSLYTLGQKDSRCASHSGAQVANPDRPGLQGQQQPKRDAKKHAGVTRSRTYARHADVAYADSTRPQERQGIDGNHAKKCPPAKRSCGQSIRPSWWSTEPTLGRVATKFPYRVDQIRALGNAVVPAVAAKAFTTLMAACIAQQTA